MTKRMNRREPGRKKAVCLVSGGLDSCVAAAVAEQRYEVFFLHLRYGQRTQRRERRSFDRICRYYGLSADRRRVVDLPFLGAVGGSALTDRAVGIPRCLSRPGDIPATYVPFRNSVFLSYAVAWAEALGASAVVIGAVESDSAGYPDCRRTYFDAYNALIREGSKAGGGIRVDPPLLTMDKTEVVRRGLELKAPLHLTWSCYGRSRRACGECESCRLRLSAFQAVGVSDPLPYRKIPKEYPL